MEPRYNSDTLNKLVSYLKQRYGINYIYSSNPNDKGYWFVKMYEFERDNDLLKNNNI
jgi:predicted Zn-dependent peptidase